MQDELRPTVAQTLEGCVQWLDDAADSLDLSTARVNRKGGHKWKATSLIYCFRLAGMLKGASNKMKLAVAFAIKLACPVSIQGHVLQKLFHPSSLDKVDAAMPDPETVRMTGLPLTCTCVVKFGPTQATIVSAFSPTTRLPQKGLSSVMISMFVCV